MVAGDYCVAPAPAALLPLGMGAPSQVVGAGETKLKYILKAA